MKNKQWIAKILAKIKYKNYHFDIPPVIDDGLVTDIIHNINEPSDSIYKWVITTDDWEISLHELTNRELISLYKQIQ